MTDVKALEPCPFCRGQAEWASRKPYLVHCANPDCLGHHYEQDEQGGYNHSFYTEAEAIAAWNARATPSPKAGPGEVERIAALRSRIAALRSRVVGADAMPSDLLTEFGKHVGWELSYAGWDDEAEWQVHQVNGGRNDREWTLIGTGQTLAAAIRAALSETRP